MGRAATQGRPYGWSGVIAMNAAPVVTIARRGRPACLPFPVMQEATTGATAVTGGRAVTGGGRPRRAAPTDGQA